MSRVAVNVVVAPRDFDLPWDNKRQDRQSFKKWLTACLAILLFVGLPMPWLVLPEVEREELEELPPQLARILLEKPEPKIPPPPPPPKKVDKKPPVEQPKPKLEQDT
ncbi:MAG: energy transducer TonB, partial [Gammaproteobacteria bacterium]|nr:energy transducer TonB [Gammaproteobacteria bacterium]